MLDEGSEASHQLFSWRQVFFQLHPGARPDVQIAAIGGCIGGRRRGSSSVYFGSLRLKIILALELLTILNQCHHHRGFVISYS